MLKSNIGIFCFTEAGIRTNYGWAPPNTTNLVTQNISFQNETSFLSPIGWKIGGASKRILVAVLFILFKRALTEKILKSSSF